MDLEEELRKLEGQASKLMGMVMGLKKNISKLREKLDEN